MGYADLNIQDIGRQGSAATIPDPLQTLPDFTNPSRILYRKFFVQYFRFYLLIYYDFYDWKE